MKQKNVWIDEEDERSILLVQQRYGCASQSQAMRMALRIAAHTPTQKLELPKQSKHAGLRHSRKSFHGLWKNETPNNLDFGAIDRILNKVNHEWSDNLERVLTAHSERT